LENPSTLDKSQNFQIASSRPLSENISGTSYQKHGKLAMKRPVFIGSIGAKFPFRSKDNEQRTQHKCTHETETSLNPYQVKRHVDIYVSSSGINNHNYNKAQVTAGRSQRDVAISLLALYSLYSMQLMQICMQSGSKF
jgi:hypothetical protein